MPGVLRTGSRSSEARGPGEQRDGSLRSQHASWCGRVHLAGGSGATFDNWAVLGCPVLSGMCGRVRRAWDRGQGQGVWQIDGHLLFVLPAAEGGTDMKKRIYPIDGDHHS